MDWQADDLLIVSPCFTRVAVKCEPVKPPTAQEARTAVFIAGGYISSSLICLARQRGKFAPVMEV